MLRQLKKKNLKFSTFDRELVLGLHNGGIPSEASLDKKGQLNEGKVDEINFNDFFQIEENQSENQSD